MHFSGKNITSKIAVHKANPLINLVTDIRDSIVNLTCRIWEIKPNKTVFWENAACCTGKQGKRHFPFSAVIAAYFQCEWLTTDRSKTNQGKTKAKVRQSKWFEVHTLPVLAWSFEIILVKLISVLVDFSSNLINEGKFVKLYIMTINIYRVYKKFTSSE